MDGTKTVKSIIASLPQAKNNEDGIVIVESLLHSAVLLMQKGNMTDHQIAAVFYEAGDKMVE